MNIDPNSDNHILSLVHLLEKERCASREIDGDIFVVLNRKLIHVGGGVCVSGDSDGTCEMESPHFTSNAIASLSLKHAEDLYHAWDDKDGNHHFVLSSEASIVQGYGCMPTLPLAATVAALVRMAQRQRGDV